MPLFIPAGRSSPSLSTYSPILSPLTSSWSISYEYDQGDIKLIHSTKEWLYSHRYSELMDVDMAVDSMTPEQRRNCAIACLELYAYFSEHGLLRKKMNVIIDKEASSTNIKYLSAHKRWTRYAKQQPLSPKRLHDLIVHSEKLMLKCFFHKAPLIFSKAKVLWENILRKPVVTKFTPDLAAVATSFWPMFLACGNKSQRRMSTDHSKYLMKDPDIKKKFENFSQNLGKTLTNDQYENYTHFTEWRIL